MKRKISIIITGLSIYGKLKLKIIFVVTAKYMVVKPEKRVVFCFNS